MRWIRIFGEALFDDGFNLVKASEMCLSDILDLVFDFILVQKAFIAVIRWIEDATFYFFRDKPCSSNSQIVFVSNFVLQIRKKLRLCFAWLIY